MPETNKGYPVRLSIDYPEKCDRLTTFFRIFIVIPIMIILALILGWEEEWTWADGWRYIYGGAGFVFAPTVLMLLFRKKYPRWWFDWNLALTKFSTRVFSYLLLLTHEYPSTDEEQGVHIEIPYPDAKKELSRGLPLVKWILVLPHIIVLFFLGIAVVVCVIIAWFAILFSTRYPRELFDFVVGAMRWSLRVDAYSFLLTTDEYPPFSLD